MRRIALTGGIATGKSHVRAALARRGVPTIDADVLAREAVAPGSRGLAAVTARFGPGVLGADGTLDRRTLADIVFHDPQARHDLEQIVHPFVRAAIDDWFAQLDPAAHSFAVADIPLLYETGRERDFDAVLVVACRPETQLQRVMARDGLTHDDALARIRAQLPTDDKVSRADYVITTDGSHAETDAQIDALVAKLRA